jgi:dienelactone hydrolase
VRSKRFFTRRIIASFAIAKLAIFVLVTLWLVRDPQPHFDARRGALVESIVAEPRVENGTSEQDVTLVGSSGLRITLAIRRPAIRTDAAGAANGDVVSVGGGAITDGLRRPLFLVLGGHERGKGAAALIGDTRGAVFASLEYPFDGNHRAKGLAILAQVPAIRRALFDTPPAVQLALDYLLSRPDIDPARVELVGASFGTPFATIAAARDTRVTRLWLAHGGGDVRALIDRGLEKEISNRWLRAPVTSLAHVLANGRHFTPERWIADVAPRPIVMMNATEDEKIPKRSVEILYAAARDPKELIWLPGTHMQGSRPDVIRSLIDAVLARTDLTPLPSSARAQPD